MLNLVKLALTLVFAAAAGLGATYFVVARGPVFGAIHAGPWLGWPGNGSNHPDPYARAAMARSGKIPLGVAEGLTFFARTDNAGKPLHGNCIYRISGTMPSGRFWTLTASTRDGRLIDNPAKRYGFTSQEIVRGTDGRFDIVVSRVARPGNWLPMGDVRHFVLVLRVYDTPLSATAATLDDLAMPTIAREGCE